MTIDTTTSPLITVTESAAAKARALAERDGRPEAALRVRVTAGGCSGFSYQLSLEDAATDDDHVVDGPGGSPRADRPRERPDRDGLHARPRRRRCWAAG